MVNRELDYIDFHDYDALRQHVDDAPSPAPGKQTHPTAPAEIFIMPPRPSSPSGRPRENPVPRPAKAEWYPRHDPAAEEPPRCVPRARRSHRSWTTAGQSSTSPWSNGNFQLIGRLGLTSYPNMRKPRIEINYSESFVAASHFLVGVCPI